MSHPFVAQIVCVGLKVQLSGSSVVVGLGAVVVVGLLGPSQALSLAMTSLSRIDHQHVIIGFCNFGPTLTTQLLRMRINCC